MKGLLVRIEDYAQDAGEAEKELLSKLKRSPETLLGMTIHDLAKEHYTSASTIVRLCKKLGCSGYKDFQNQLAYEVALFQESRDIAFKRIAPNERVEDVILKVTKKNIESMETTRKLIEPKVIEDCVMLLEKSRNIALFGLGTSMLVAKDLHLKLLRANVPCTICEDFHAQMLQAKNLTEEDLAIVISYSGMTEEMVKCADLAKAGGARIITITRAVASRLTEASDYILPVASTELIHRSGAMASRISQLNVVDILFTAYVTKNYDSCMKQFGRTHLEKKGEADND